MVRLATSWLLARGHSASHVSDVDSVLRNLASGKTCMVRRACCRAYNWNLPRDSEGDGRRWHGSPTSVRSPTKAWAFRSPTHAVVGWGLWLPHGQQQCDEWPTHDFAGCAGDGGALYACMDCRDTKHGSGTPHDALPGSGDNGMRTRRR